MEHAPNNDAILDTLGWVLFKHGDYKAAVKKLTSAIQGIPNSPTIRYHIGQAYLKGGNAKSTLNEFRNALRISQ
jgi:predicted Zn-dependent protease